MLDLSEFRRAFGDAGLNAPPEILADGAWHPCNAMGGRTNTDAGRYKLYPDGFPTGILYNWRTGESLTWHPEGARPRMTAADRAQTARRVEAAKAEREAADEDRQARVAADSERRWSAMVECAEHDYLTRKHVGAYGVRTARFGSTLYVPMRDIDGRLWGLQEIWTDGTKLYQMGARVSGLFHQIGT